MLSPLRLTWKPSASAGRFAHTPLPVELSGQVALPAPGALLVAPVSQFFKDTKPAPPGPFTVRRGCTVILAWLPLVPSATGSAPTIAVRVPLNARSGEIAIDPVRATSASSGLDGAEPSSGTASDNCASVEPFGL